MKGNIFKFKWFTHIICTCVRTQRFSHAFLYTFNVQKFLYKIKKTKTKQRTEALIKTENKTGKDKTHLWKIVAKTAVQPLWLSTSWMGPSGLEKPGLVGDHLREMKVCWGAPCSGSCTPHPPIASSDHQTSTDWIWFIWARMVWTLLSIFFWCPANVTPSLMMSLRKCHQKYKQ